jgi:FdhE protein
MQRAAEMLQALIGALGALRVALPAGVPDLAAARVRLESGVPALEGEPLIDGERFVENVRAIAERLSADATAGGAARTLGAAFAAPEARPDAELCAEAAMRGAWDAVAALARAHGLDEDAFVTIADYSARPVLRAASAQLRALLQETTWSRGYCPACGAPPLLAELRGGERILRCGRCAAAWSYPRMRCSSCGEDDHRKLGYLHGEGEGEFRRADRCDSCGSYLKAIAVLDPLGADALLEEDLASAALDLAAVEQGYHR